MLERLEKLEGFAKDAQPRLARIEAQLEGIVRDFATKADLQAARAEFHKELHSMTWKIIGACAALVAVTFWLARNVEPAVGHRPVAAATVQPAPAAASSRLK